MAPVSRRKEMVCPYTVMTTRAPCGRRQWSGQGILGLFSFPWSGLKGWLEYCQGLRSPHNEGHGTVSSLMSLLMALWTWFRWPAEIRAGPGSVTLLTTFEAGTQWSSSLRWKESLGSHQSCLNGLGQYLVFLLWAFPPQLLFTLKTNTKTSV